MRDSTIAIFNDMLKAGVSKRAVRMRAEARIEALRTVNPETKPHTEEVIEEIRTFMRKLED